MSVTMPRPALLFAVVAVVATVLAGTVRADSSGAVPFEEAVDLTLFDQIAVHTEGRVKSYESFARGMMRYVAGPRSIDGHSPAFTYLDLMLRPDRYPDRPIVYVKNKLLRARIDRVLEGSMLPADRYAFTESGLLSPRVVESAPVQKVLNEARQDLIRTAKFVQMVDTAVALTNPMLLESNLRIVPPPGGTFDDSWHTPREVVVVGTEHEMLSQMPVELRTGITTEWTRFTEGWRRSDAAAVNEAGARLAELLPKVNTDPEIYPSMSRLSWESWYFRSKNMTWVWLLYAVSLVPLLLFVAFRWNGAWITGMALFLVAFGFHTFAVMLRWYISGRWPNSNMFEAVTTAAWFGGAFAVLFEPFVRRSPMRGLVALGAGGASAVALMCAHFLPVQLDAHISNRMPVLHDVWLYIHTNVIIFSYALIFMAAVSAGLYMLLRAGRKLRGVPGAGEYARVGGAGSLIMTAPDGSSYLGRARASVGQVLDGTTMILLEMSFVLLWAGIVMGAIWADHSWGRPWGWDPKEVFALNTFLIFALLIHTRMKVQDKGLWTAILAIIGCVVMLFNWIIINFTIAGLHSYA